MHSSADSVSGHGLGHLSAAATRERPSPARTWPWRAGAGAARRATRQDAELNGLGVPRAHLFSRCCQSRSVTSSASATTKQVATVLVARGRIAAAPLRIRLRIWTAVKSGYAQVLLPPSPQNSAPSLLCGWIWAPPANTWFFGPHESTPETTSRSVQPFCMIHARRPSISLVMKQTDTHRDRPRYMRNNRLHPVLSFTMRPNNAQMFIRLAQSSPQVR